MAANLYNKGDFIGGAFQQYLGRQPDPAGADYWQGQQQAGASPADIMNGVRGSQESQINGLYQALLGRAPDPAGLAHYSQQFANDGPQAVYDSINSSPEARNYSLGDGFREQARAATAGINNMPGILSDFGRFANRGDNVPYSDPNSIFGGAGADTVTNMNALLAGLFGPPEVKAEEKPDDPPPVEDEKDKLRKLLGDQRKLGPGRDRYGTGWNTEE